MSQRTLVVTAFVFVGALLCALPALRAEEEGDPEWLGSKVAEVPVSLPAVPRAERDRPLPPRQRFLVSAAADGSIHYALAMDAEAAHTGKLKIGAAAPNTRTLEELSKLLRVATRGTALRQPDGTSKVRLHLRADGAFPWICFLWLGERVVEAGVGINHVLFSVRREGTETDAHWVLPYAFARQVETFGEVPPKRLVLHLEGGEEDRKVVRVRADAEGAGSPRELGVIDWRAPGREGMLQLLAAVFPDAGTEVSISLARNGARKFTLGDVLPIVSAVEGAGARVLFQTPPAGFLVSPDRLPVQGPRHPFGAATRPTRRTENWGSGVQHALRWLKAHQSPDGRWEAAGFGAWCDGQRASQGPDGAGRALYDVGVTGLALLAFLGAGYTGWGKHPYEETIHNGLKYLASVQDPEGCFGPRESQHWVYNHAAASWAMVEATGMSRGRIWRESAQKALDFIALCRNPYFAWRYGKKPGDNDMSVTGWMFMPLALAKVLNETAMDQGKAPVLTIDEEAFDGTRALLDKLTDPDYGRTGYIQRGGSSARPQDLIDRFPGDKSEAITALAVVLRTYIGEDPRKSLIIKKGLDLLEKCPPVWNPASGDIDMYYWYWGAMATWQAGGQDWKRWEAALDKAVRANQRRDTTYGMYKGSWDPIGPWGLDGGRVYSTALMALILETPTRYARRFGR
jgi:hypothetical protein